MSQIRFGTDGVRGEWGSEITPETGYRLGAAASEVFGGMPWVMVQDTREFNPELAEAFALGAKSQDADTINLGVLPTPAAALLAGRLSHIRGKEYVAVSLSASHNAAHDAGIKVFGPRGNKLDDDTNRQISDRANEIDIWPGLGRVTPTSQGEVDDLRYRYVQTVLSTVDPELRQGRFLQGKNIVVDAAQGAAHWSAPYILGQLGANVVGIYTDLSSPINHECGVEQPDEAEAELFYSFPQQSGYAMILDGDADRLLAFSRGYSGNRDDQEFLDGDDSLVIATQLLRATGRSTVPGVAVTAYSNLGLTEYMRSQGIDVLEVDNGDRYILEGLRKHGYPVGGEQSGHTIYAADLDARQLTWTGDGTITALQHLQAEAIFGKPVHKLADWERLPHIQENVRLPQGVSAKDLLNRPEVIATIEQARADNPGGVVHVRGSGTEPVVRLLIKGHDETRTNDVAERLEHNIRKAAQ
jgi:phosphoglucosamine mutase